MKARDPVLHRARATRVAAGAEVDPITAEVVRLEGGGAGKPNGAQVRYPDGSVRVAPKATRVPAPKGAVIELSTGGVGGYGERARRSVAAIRHDVREGYVSDAFVRRHYLRQYRAMTRCPAQARVTLKRCYRSPVITPCPG